MEGKILIVVANLLKRNGKFLLVRERKRFFAGKKLEGKWNLPAGRLEKESLIECLIRETKEETIFETKPAHLIGIYQYPRVLGFNLIFFIFNSKILRGKFKPSKEIEKIKWFSLKEIKNLERKGELRGNYILKAIEDLRAKRKIPLKFIKILKLK